MRHTRSRPEPSCRVQYLSTSWSGRPDFVSGAVFVPHGTPPPGGWPVVSWAHGTVGVADRCAPSIAGRTQRDIDYLDAWLNAGYLAAHPGWDPSAVLTPRGIEVLALAETRYCYDDLNAYPAQQNITNGDVLTDMNALLTFAKLMQYDEIPIAHYSEPVFIAQGTADQLLLPGMTEKTANELAAAGTDVTFRYYEGADHDTILAAALPDLLTWVNSRRDQRP